MAKKEAVAQSVNENDELLNPQEAASFLGLSKDHLMLRKSQWKLPFVRIGGRRIGFFKSDLIRWLRSRTA